MKRRIAWIGLLVVIFSIGLTWVGWVVPTRSAVAVGAGMLAKQMCSCVYIAGRSVAACRADQMEALDPIQIEMTDEPSSVRAFVPLLGERLAVHREGFGCTLE